MKLSIIIPAYNAEPYIEKLITKLHAQVTKDVEVIVVDDGSDFPYLAAYPEIQVIRFEKNRGVSAARNAGLDRAKGEWVAFIDADDLIADDYVKRILAELAYKPDYVYLSWKTFGGGWDYEVILKSPKDKFPPFNLCCWNRVYKRSMIGAVRFNEKKKIAEDAEFIASVKEEGKKKAFIGTPIYFYRTSPRNSLTERFNRGELDMERIVYHLPHLPQGGGGHYHDQRQEQGTGRILHGGAAAADCGNRPSGHPNAALQSDRKTDPCASGDLSGTHP